jgi:hypothetical protein
MKFHQTFNQNIIAVAGTWDPLLPRHIALFKELLRYSKKKGLNPYVLIFYPTPVNFIKEDRFKDYFDLDARVEILKYMGFNNLIVIEFEKPDLERSSAEFLDELTRQTGISINELWIGENQQFGAGAQGFLSIRHECANRNIKLRVLKNSFLVNLDKESFYQNFNAGKFDLSSSVVGYFPTYKLKPDRQIDIHDGVYSAKLRVLPFNKTNEIALNVKIVNKTVEEIKKPDTHTWLVLNEKISG